MSMMVNPSRFAAPYAGPHGDSYAYTGAAQTYTVQAGETSITFNLWGGAGGGGRFNSANGGGWSGAGARVQGTMAVAPGDVITVEVGRGGRGGVGQPTTSGGAGGWPDGGGGARGDVGCGGGGGSTRIYKNSVLMAVAGAGGGGAYYAAGKAGAGGYTSGQSSANAGGGSGGSQTAGGLDRSDTGNANKTGRSIVSFPGAQRTGGWGGSTGDSTTLTTDDGGGGGGGYWGGGGGGGDGLPGGGGSSWAHATDVTSVTHTSGVGEVQSYTTGAPAGTAQGVDSGTDNLPGGDGYAILSVT